MLRALHLTSLLTLATAAPGCIAYNDTCQALVDDPNERVAFIAKGTEVWLDKPNARHANNAIGQQAADAFVWVYRDGDRPVDFAVVNGGAIRAEGLCVTRNILREGPLSNGVLHEILLFENPVVAVDLSEEQVVQLFEHSVERLFASPSPIVSPSGQFLQVSAEVSMDVDCALPGGSRVTALSIKGQALRRPGRPIEQARFRVATSSYLVQGGDGYSMLSGTSTDPSRYPEQAKRFGGIDSNITAAYLKQSPFNQTVEDGLRVDPGRIRFTNCSTPTRPSN
jgi:2',3'-cyclic-nucleotide 2'-phosphodiesterase (5'-nucleotidase family)